MNITKYIANSEKGYGLRLADGQGGQFIPTKGLKTWVEKLASIMELEKCEPNGYSRLIFVKGEFNKDRERNSRQSQITNILENLLPSGWKQHNLRALKLWHHHEVQDIICEIGPQKYPILDITRMSLSLHPIYKQTLDSGGLPIHAALVEWNGVGFLLSAPGNTGKSTCCRRLPSPWHALGDDEALVVVDKQTLYQVHPFPTWSDFHSERSGRTWNVQKHLPLVAIFFLEHGKTDKVVPIGQGEAAILINQSARHVCRRS